MSTVAPQTPRLNCRLWLELGAHVVPIREMERLSGLNFFPLLTGDAAQRMKSGQGGDLVRHHVLRRGSIRPPFIGTLQLIAPPPLRS